MSALQAALEPLDRATLQDRAYGGLREAIMGGVFSPGTAVSIRAAARALGVSPMPVRAALQRLEAEGALVAQGPQRRLMIPDLTGPEYAELRDIRLALEGLAAERAAALATPSHLRAVEAACRAMQAAADTGDLTGYVRSNWAFHRGVYAPCGLPTLLGLIEQLWMRVGPYIPLMMPDQRSLADSMPDHWSALAALRARDGAGVRAAIEADIGRCAVALIAALPAGDAK